MESLEWRQFFEGVERCDRCKAVQSTFKVTDPTSGQPISRAFKVVNPLLGLTATDRWGMPWYDRHRNLDAEVLVVGMDFGSETTIGILSALLAANPDAEFGEDVDKTFVKLTTMLFEPGDDELERIKPSDVYVTNAALCVREEGCPETGELSRKIYANCSSHLRAQIDMVKPYVIVALGNVALEAVCRALGRSTCDLGLVGQVTKDAHAEATVEINQARVAVRAFLHPGREQPHLGWDYKRHRTDLYAPLRRLLKAYRQTSTKAAFRAKFGDLPPLVITG